MSYHALTIGLSDNLFAELKSRLSQYDLHFIASTTVKEASRLLNEQIFHLLVADLEFLRNIQQIEWLSSVRHISFAPVVILTDTPEEDMSHMIELGMDICVSDNDRIRYSVGTERVSGLQSQNTIIIKTPGTQRLRHSI